MGWNYSFIDRNREFPYHCKRQLQESGILFNYQALKSWDFAIIFLKSAREIVDFMVKGFCSAASAASINRRASLPFRIGIGRIGSAIICSSLQFLKKQTKHLLFTSRGKSSIKIRLLQTFHEVFYASLERFTFACRALCRLDITKSNAYAYKMTYALLDCVCIYYWLFAKHFANESFHFGSAALYGLHQGKLVARAN